jgi:hypothetical protein
MDTNSRRTRVIPAFGWHRDNDGIEWPTQLVALASGLARQIEPGPFQNVAIDSERLVYPNADRSLWMLLNAKSLAPHDASRFQEFQRRVVRNPNRAKAPADSPFFRSPDSDRKPQILHNHD